MFSPSFSGFYESNHIVAELIPHKNMLVPYFKSIILDLLDLFAGDLSAFE